MPMQSASIRAALLLQQAAGIAPSAFIDPTSSAKSSALKGRSRALLRAQAGLGPAPAAPSSRSKRPAAPGQPSARARTTRPTRPRIAGRPTDAALQSLASRRRRKRLGLARQIKSI